MRPVATLPWSTHWRVKDYVLIGPFHLVGCESEPDRPPIDILTQVSALTKALEGVALGLLDDHLRHCVLEAAKTGDDNADTKIAEASQAISRLVRS